MVKVHSSELVIANGHYFIILWVFKACVGLCKKMQLPISADKNKYETREKKIKRGVIFPAFQEARRMTLT